MLVDMHLHECTYSTDSFLHLEEIVSIARQRGWTRSASRTTTAWACASARRPIPARSAIPSSSAWNFSRSGAISPPGDRRHPRPARQRTGPYRPGARKDGFCVSCHPFRSNNRGLREHLRDVHGLDGVEVLNGSTPLEENRTALRFCRELGLKAIGASDAHVPEQVGKYVTWLPETVTTLPDFVTALHTLETRPAIWTGSGYDVVTEF